MGVIDELQRRKVFKVGATYLVVAWLAVQGASIGFPAFDAPPWALRIFILVALLGFPVAVAMAWSFEVTPQGLKADPDATGGKRVYTAVVVLAALALGWYFYGQPAFRRGDSATPAANAPANANIAAPAAVTPAAPIPPKSIAVLPFTDLSPGHDQEYFSDGMADELLNALVRVKDLKVAGRTSSFHYRNRNDDLRTVGRALGVANVLEGSVRTQGKRVRITAQLIRTDDDFHVWSQTYDGDLTDIFDLQERIARKITEELSVVLEGEQKTRLVPVATTNPEAYALYLQASAIFNRRDGAHFPDAVAELQRAVALDPTFARAHARLATVCAIAYIYMDLPGRDALLLEHARRAMELDPTLGEPHAALAQRLATRRDHRGAWAEFERALALEPGDITANFWFAIEKMQVGYQRAGRAALDRVLVLDPQLPNALFWRGNVYVTDGQLARGDQLLQGAAAAGLPFAGLGQSLIAHARGDDDLARRQLASGLRSLVIALDESTADMLARGVYGSAAEHRMALGWLDRQLASGDPRPNGIYVHLLLRMGEAGRVLQYSRTPTSNDGSYLSMLWSDVGKPVRSRPEFPQYLREVGLTALWDVQGAPDMCRRVSPGSYACD